MSKLIYFKRYLYVIDRLRNRPCSFNELQEHVIRKLQNDDIDTTFEYAIRTFERDKKDISTLFGIDIHYNQKDKTYAIDEEEIEDQSVTRIRLTNQSTSFLFSNQKSSQSLKFGSFFIFE